EAGDVEAALAWTSVARGASNIDPFEVAWIEGLSVLARDTGASAGSDEVARRIVEAAGDDNRRAAAVKLLSLWTVFDIAAPAEGRALMAAQRGGDGDRISPWAILSIDAAAQDAAAAEAILRILTHTRGDPSDIGATEIAAMADALVVLNAQTAARLLTLEATGYWKASL
ncbi:MAG: hypothetical protein AAFQ67_05780, partial [Pseudomonadota bacterium]